jgi:hypothetical protein
MLLAVSMGRSPAPQAVLPLPGGLFLSSRRRIARLRAARICRTLAFTRNASVLRVLMVVAIHQTPENARDFEFFIKGRPADAAASLG